MAVVTRSLDIRTEGEVDMINITSKVSQAVEACGLKNGIVTVFIPGSTAAITTIEYEPGLCKDFPQILDKVAPKDAHYEHEKRWGDHNGHSHVRASFIGPSLTVPLANGHLTLGTWQQIVLIELDVQPRDRRLILQILGE